MDFKKIMKRTVTTVWAFIITINNKVNKKEKKMILGEPEYIDETKKILYTREGKTNSC